MPETQSKERFCNLTLALFWYGGVDTLYSAKSGLEQRMALLGHIEDFAIPRDDRFHGKIVYIVLQTPPDLEWQEQTKIEEEIDSACGQLDVRKNVESKQYQTGEEAPISALIFITPEAFEAIHRQAEAFDFESRQFVSATVTLVGKSLPETDDPERASRFGVKLTDLDDSADKAYAIGDFKISDTRPFYPLRDRVLSVERKREEDYDASLSILLTDAGYEFGIESGMAHSIWCAGRVISASGKPYEGAKVTVKFEEWWTHELPERAFFGEFSYWPKPPDEEYSSDSPFWFHLRHVPDDTRDLLIPLLTQEAGTQVTLTVRLANKEEELLAATDELHGNVWRYDFKVRRRLVNDSP